MYIMLAYGSFEGLPPVLHYTYGHTNLVLDKPVADPVEFRRGVHHSIDLGET